MERTDKILIGVAAGALVLRALRGADVREDLARVSGAFDRAHDAFKGMARRAVGCIGNDQCNCAICAEEKS